MSFPDRGLFLGGHFTAGHSTAEIRAPWDGEVVTRVAQADWSQVDEALTLAHRERERLWTSPSGGRHRLCSAIAARLGRRASELADVICAEAGKPISAARAEVARAVWTFEQAAAAALQPSGEVVPIDLDPAQAGFSAFSRRVPSGVIAGIAPFNFPLNLVAHKVAPALAVGAPIVLKPPPQAPSAALILGEIALEAGAPAAALQVLPCDNAIAERLACDARVAVVSFTGSAKVGWQLKQKLGRARALLELGGNAAVIVAADAELDRAIDRCAVGGYGYAGQVCISVQRILVHRSLHARFLEAFRAKVATYGVRDPRETATLVGPLIDQSASERIERWLDEARQGGATVEGGQRSGNRLEPAIVTGAQAEAKVVREEVFGPVTLVDAFDDLPQAFAEVNRSDYGLQAGIFTSDLRAARQAFEALEVGAVVVNEAPTFRSDGMPYGGVKGSGLGREGVRYAIDAFCEPRLLVLT